MKISQIIVENRKRLVEGGNLAIRGHEAEHLDLKVTNRGYIVPILNNLLASIDAAFAKQFKQPLWNPSLLRSGEFLSGSSLHFFNVQGIPDETFVSKKPTVGDMDTMVNKELEAELSQFLTQNEDKQIGPAVLRGFQRGNEQFSSLWELQAPPIKIQIDFEFVEFEGEKPTDWARFSHSSAWDDLQAGVKGVFHKLLIQAFTALTRRDFYLRKLVGRGKARQEEDVPTVDNMYSFAVSSKEGGGLRAKYEPVMDTTTGQPEIKDGKPVMRAAPTSGYIQDIGKIFQTVLGKRLDPKKAQELSKNFWSFSGLLDIMNQLLSPEEKNNVVQAFLLKVIGPGAQGMYKNNPDKDRAEKTTAINHLLKVLKVPKPANLDQMMKDYYAGYRMTSADEAGKKTNEIVKGMAKNALDEDAPNYKRKGIPHIYNPGSSVEMKDADFVRMCQEIAGMDGKLDGAPINLKVDGAGIRFGKDEEGKPFFMTSKVTDPKYAENYGDFEQFGNVMGQDPERLEFTKKYDEALKTIVSSDFIKRLPADTIVQAEMLFMPMGKQSEDGITFVNIPYDQKKLGTIMTLVPFSVKTFSTGEPKPDAAKIKQELLRDSTKEIKIVNNQLKQRDLDVSSIVNPIVKNADALLAAVKSRGESEQKAKAKEILSTARKQLSDAIINSPRLEGKDQLGNMIEGLVLNLPSGLLAKVTSTDMKEKMAVKQAANRKPTENNRSKPAVVTVGSFVGHKGHEQLINQTIDTAKKVGGDPYIFVSPAVGPDDPIPPEMKLQTLRKLYPEYANNIQLWNAQGTPMKKIEKELVLPENSPYNKIILLVGSDRYDGMKNWMDSLERRMKDPAAVAKYGGTQDQVDFETIRTEREEGKGGTGISFTMLRNILKDPNASEEAKLKVWSNAFDSNKLGTAWIKQLMHTASAGIKHKEIKEFIQRIKPLIGEATIEQKAKFVKLLSEAKAQLYEYNIPKNKTIVRESKMSDIVGPLIKAFNLEHGGEEKWANILPLGTKSSYRRWRRGDGNFYTDPNKIVAFSDEYLKLQPKFFPWLTQQPGVQSAGKIRGEFRSSDYSDAVKYKGLLFVDRGSYTEYTTPSRLRNSSVWHQQVDEGSGRMYSARNANIVQELGNGYFLGDDSYDDLDGFVKDGYSVYYQEDQDQYRLVGEVKMSPYRNPPGHVENQIKKLIHSDQTNLAENTDYLDEK
jgi:hypothetical protein